MNLHFLTMHELSKKIICVNCMEQKIRRPEELVHNLIGQQVTTDFERIILIFPSDKADFEIRMFYADASEDCICIKGMLCAGKYLYEQGLTNQNELHIETRSGIKLLKLTVEDGVVTSVEIDMGKASLRSKDMPVDTEYDTFISQPLVIGGEAYLVSCVFIGMPHAVTYCEELDTLPIGRVGTLFENHEKFPAQIHTEFIRRIDCQTLQVRVWEPKDGESYNNGAGACAAVVAAVIVGHCAYQSEITVRLSGGNLYITYFEDGRVFMRGSASHVLREEVENE